MFITLEQQELLNSLTEVLVNEEVDQDDLELLSTYTTWLKENSNVVLEYVAEEVVEQFSKIVTRTYKTP